MSTGEFSAYAVLALVTFAAVRWTVQWVLNNGLFARVYLRYIFPKRTIAAYEQGDANLAEQYVYTAYLIQLSARKQSDRERAVQYLTHLNASQELADRLIETLPRQQRRSVQARMAALLRKTLVDLENSGRGTRANLVHKIEVWSRAVSMWVTLAIVLVLGAVWLPPMSIGQMITLGLVALVVAFLPVWWIVHDTRVVLKWGLLCVGVTMGALWAFSSTAHAGVDSTGRVSMRPYGYPGVNTQVTYPSWLLASDADVCSRKVTMMVFGDAASAVDSIEISLGYDSNVLAITDKNCQSLSPRFSISTTNPAGVPIEFFVKPLDRDALLNGSTTVTPLVRNRANNSLPVPAGELAFTIQFEDPLWQTIRDLCMATGAVTVPAFVWLIAGQLRKKQ